jgi:hypothetical protein
VEDFQSLFVIDYLNNESEGTKHSKSTKTHIELETYRPIPESENIKASSLLPVTTANH